VLDECGELRRVPESTWVRDLVPERSPCLLRQCAQQWSVEDSGRDGDDPNVSTSKGTQLSAHTAEELDRVADELNDRPRKRLAFRKPIEQIGELLLR